MNKKLRRTGVTSKVVMYFIQTIFHYCPNIDFIHAMTDKKNKASANFLYVCGFHFDPTERLSKEHEFDLLTRPALS